MMRAARLTACLALMLAAACGPKPRPITMHDLQQNDVAVCFKSASIGNTHMEGGATLLMYVDADGAIPASWFYDGAKLASPTFYRCMTTTVVESMLAAAPVDHLFGVNVTCEENGCQLLPFDKLPDGPLDESLASATLTFSDWADSTDKAWAYYYTHKYSDAQAAFSSILEVTPNDPRALRGLAQTLTDSGGDMK